MSEHEEIIFNLLLMYFSVGEMYWIDGKHERIMPINLADYEENLKHEFHKVVLSCFPQSEICTEFEFETGKHTTINYIAK